MKKIFSNYYKIILSVVILIVLVALAGTKQSVGINEWRV